MNYCRCQCAFALVGLIIVAPFADGQDEDDDYRDGLVARYENDAGQVAERVDESIAFDWQSSAPDGRLNDGPFRAKWTGFLRTQLPGEYQFAVFAQGRVEIKVDDEQLLAADFDGPTWRQSKSIERPFGYYELEVAFGRSAEHGRLSLYWSGPGFDWEPITPRWLSHEKSKSPSNQFERGRLLSRAFRCDACHKSEGNSQPLDAPALDRLSGNIARSWIVDRLTKSADEEDARRMPHFDLSEREAEQVAAYLLAAKPRQKKELAIPPRPRVSLPGSKKKGRDKLKQPTADEGQELFISTGCLACHQVGDLGTSGLFDGGDLSRVAEKRPKSFFERWLLNPTEFNRHHRMPVFELTSHERKSIVAFLAQRRESISLDGFEWKESDTADITAGRKLVEQHRCGSCHLLPGTSELLPRIKDKWSTVSASSDWNSSCVQQEPSATRPGYILSDENVVALQAYYSGVQLRDSRRPGAGSLLLAESNCLSCHARETAEGLRPALTAAVAEYPQLAPKISAMVPPSLNSVGDKLTENALIRAIRRDGSPHRPYLSVRMPKFRLNDEAVDLLAQHLMSKDRIPNRPTPVTPIDERTLKHAGARLVTTAGFGCTSCHQVGDVMPPKGPLNARGPTLSEMGKRIRRSWYERWVRDPARIVPQMEMPSVKLPVRGVLHDKLDDQLAAVWRTLNEPGFQPPLPNPLRVVRKSGIKASDEWASVLTDVIRFRGKRLIKPLVVGLPNRHSMLLDLDTGRVAGWWMGDVARQRTEGKTWFWESAEADLLTNHAVNPHLSIRMGDRFVEPTRVGQFITEADSWEHANGGITLKYRFHFRDHASITEQTVRVTHKLTPIWPGVDARNGGIAVSLEFSGLSPGQELRWRLFDEKDELTKPIDASGRVVQLSPNSHVKLVESGAAKMTPPSVVTGLFASEDGNSRIQLEYRTSLPGDQFPPIAVKIDPPEPLQLQVVPGFDAVRLPIADEWMPTGLAWNRDGEMFVSSLKGRVWMVSDSDRDGMLDRTTPISDELAAPFGLAAYGTYVDVLNKYALLRLHDKDGDGRAERTETLASGWGHTADYHDWVIGLPRDAEGRYFMTIPCQQDDRPQAAAQWRGHTLRLDPREPTDDDPRQFSVHSISGGHRFPIGIARDRHGDLFVTDNQGNYNPFNELNHVQQGARYGFINKLERKPDFKPALTPPAIDIPHPWTRSVNGIGFLDTPPSILADRGSPAFGAFEGHLIGCEYDTRRLVRMSLQRVGDTIQGAVYPFTLPRPTKGEPLLGPLTCAVSPDGDLYIGCIRDSGWGGANNIGTLVRMRPTGELPPGIATVEADTSGLLVTFTQPLDLARAEDLANYSVSSYTRVSTPAYGGPDKDRRVEKIRAIEIDDDGRRVRLELDELRAGYVYELHVQSVSRSGEKLFPDEAYYTMRRVPESQ